MPVSNRWNRLRYSLIAPLYDAVVGFSGQRQRALSLLDLKPGDSLLIPGIGTGLDFPHIPEGVEVTGADLTPAMLERARRRAEAEGVRAKLELGDAQALPYPDESFDAVALHLIVAVVGDPQSAVSEAFRVVRRGGRVVVFDKFVDDVAGPTTGRRLMNMVTRLVATDVTVRLGPLVEDAGFAVIHREPAGLRTFFQIALLERP